MNDYRTNTIGYKEETILTRERTLLEVDVKLVDTEHMLKNNSYGEYVFTFQPLTSYAYQALQEACESAVTMVELYKSPYSQKEPRLQVCKKGSYFYCSQLFAPKVSEELEHYSLYSMRDATLKLHLREDCAGDIYLNAEYVDLFDQNNGIDDAAPVSEDTLIDYDF